MSATGPVLGYGTNGFADHTLDDALTVIHAAGYRAVALTLGHPHLDPFAADWRERTLALRSRLDELGLRVVVETGARYLLDPFAKHRPTLVDEEAGPRVRFLERAIEIAALLGADAVSLWSGVVPAGADAAAAWRLLVERMRGVVATAERHGVRLAVEPEPGMLVETVADALLLRRELGDPESVGLTVDLGHCVVVEPDGVVGALRSAGDLLLNVQVDDMLPERHEHLELGTGSLDLAAAFATLAEIGYRGIAAVELPRHSHDAPRLAVASLAAMEEALGGASSHAEHPWTAAARSAVLERPSRIERFFPAAGREAGREPLRPAEDPHGLVHGTHDDAARAALVQAAAQALGDDDLAALLLRLYRGGDGAERRGVLAGLNALGDPGRATTLAGLELTADALRANDTRLVAAAMGSFARRHLDAHAWRHGVLKLVFLGVPLAAVAGLEERSDAELRAMAGRFADERRAAGRPLPDDLAVLLPS
ncbi:sugar phosphate isomerase/epimerase [Rathayibacter sp. AY1C2]|uniref:EboA domain-containing protein n=1 Tax=unclassified Rathayibacter TaxID=2609250 RepID=UPI000CE8D314|nr:MULTISPECIES: EboA domain-containing protein [unclassified Rathayibacter]PPF56751.1 sugar phosphate isomerase/epimerase [Rathayibacter sp. AY1C2]PPH57055.1 sugar phosphate isomerase/epimerase [Rathayibacter sp. AY1E1]